MQCDIASCKEVGTWVCARKEKKMYSSQTGGPRRALTGRSQHCHEAKHEKSTEEKAEPEGGGK
jgi:hypothetical protein